MVDGVIRCLEAGDVETASTRLFGDAASAFRAIKVAWHTDCPGAGPGDVSLVLSGAFHAVTGLAVLPANLLFGSLYGAHPAWAFGVGSACALTAAIALSLSRGKDG